MFKVKDELTRDGLAVALFSLANGLAIPLKNASPKYLPRV
jgi:hypothetical protein